MMGGMNLKPLPPEIVGADGRSPAAPPTLHVYLVMSYVIVNKFIQYLLEK